MNKVEIYYFTGTGNSLVLARDIANRLNGRLIPIASLMEQESITPEADVVGIVFPVYNSMNDGLPLTVIEFAKKLVSIQSKYIFAVCNSGGGMAPVNETLSRWIPSRGGKLSALFTVKMPFNITPVPTVEKQTKMFDQWEKKLDMICEAVQERKEVPFGIPVVLKVILAPLGALMRSIFISKMQKQCHSPHAKTFYELTPLMDKSFSVDDKCDGCGTCAKICPVRNIELENKKPSWQHHCETCLACCHWCPNEAIHTPYYKVRYHHPKVQISDMLNQR